MPKSENKKLGRSFDTMPNGTLLPKLPTKTMEKEVRKSLDKIVAKTKPMGGRKSACKKDLSIMIKKICLINVNNILQFISIINHNHQVFHYQHQNQSQTFPFFLSSL